MIYTAKNLCKEYKDVVLRYPDFEINRGDICCVIGENGYGKSTLLKMLALRDIFFNGELRFFDKDVKEIIKKFIYSSFYYSFYSKVFLIDQDDVFLPELSLDDNIKLLYGDNYSFIKSLILKNGLFKEDFLAKKTNQISLFDLKFLLTFLVVNSEKEIILVDEFFSFNNSNINDYKIVFNSIKKNGKTFIFSVATSVSNLIFNEIDCIIDLNKKKFCRKNNTNSLVTFTSNEFIKTNFDNNIIAKIIKIRFKEFIFLTAFITIFTLFHLIYLKTSIYLKYPTSYLVENVSLNDTQIIETILKKSQIFPLEIDKRIINNKIVKIFTFDNYVFNNYILNELKLVDNKKNYCIASKEVGNLSISIKKEYNCDDVVYTDNSFLKQDLFLLTKSDSIDYNSLFILSYDDNNFRDMLKFLKKNITKISCDFNEGLRDLYSYLNKILPFFYFIFFISLIFFERSLFSYRLSQINMLINYRVKILYLYFVFLYDVIKNFFLSIVVSSFFGYIFIRLFFLNSELSYLYQGLSKIYLILIGYLFLLAFYKGFLFLKITRYPTK